MGGCQIITEQAEFATYDRVLVLGYTAIGVHLTIDGRKVPGKAPHDEILGDYIPSDHAAFVETFHWDDVPADVLKVDEALVVETPRMIGAAATTMGIVSEDAGRISVPVYICLGERDVSPRPYDEPHYYKSSPYVTLHILPRSGHCQNFASTRREMFERIDGWLRSIPA